MTTYPVKRSYSLIAAVSLVIAGLFVWDLLNAVEIGNVLFLAVSLGVLAWSVRMAMTSVSLTPAELLLRVPLAGTRTIEYGQMLSVTEEGRRAKSIVIAYHPRTDAGLLDLDSARTVVLPAVRDQDTLLDLLLERAPV